jgi:hypothetical protein
VDLKRQIRKILLESYLMEDEEEELTLYKALRRYIRGSIGAGDLEESDRMILEVRQKSNNLGESTIVFDFDDDEKLFESLGMDENDVWFARVVNSSYDDYEFMDAYQVEDDFKEGYTVFGDLSAENKDKIEKILFLTMGKEVVVGREQQDDMESARFLINMFPNDIDDILTEYRWAKDSEMNKTAKRHIEIELGNFFEKTGFKLIRDYDYISTTPGNLLMWYAKTGEKDLDFEDLFKIIIEQSGGSRLGGWYENSYEFQDSDNFDSEYFNRGVGRSLDNILEKLEDIDFNTEGFANEFKKLTNKFKLGMFHELPKDKNYQFAIMGFNPENLNIKILAQNIRSWKKKPLELSVESLYRLLYQPELFDLSELIPESIKEYFDPLYFLKQKFSKKDDKELPGGMESVHAYGDEFQKIVDLIFKKAIKEHPVENLKGLKVTSIYPQEIVDNDGRPKEIRWNVRLKPVVPDWFNYQKNLGFVHNTINFEQIFRNYQRYMGLDSTIPVSNDSLNNEVPNIVNLDLVVKKFETF